MKQRRILAIVGILAMSITLPVGAQHVVTHEQEPNNEQWQANPVRMGNAIIGSAKRGDVDYFKTTTSEYLARYQVDVQIYTPHPPLECGWFLVVQCDGCDEYKLFRRWDTEFRYAWTNLSETDLYYIGIWSACDDLHYQIDFSKVRGASYTYLPIIRRREGGR